MTNQPGDTAIPAGAPAPTDRKKKKTADGRKAEADGFIVVQQCGVELTIPLGGKVPLAAYIAFKDGDEMLGTKLLVGAEQWEAFMAANPTVDDFAEIGKKLTDVLGN